jgi:hypothetical protein
VHFGPDQPHQVKVMHSMMDELASVVTDAASVRAVDKIAGQVAAAAGSQAPDEKGAQSAWEKQRKTMLQVRRVFTFSSLFTSQTDACADVYQQLAAAARRHPVPNCTSCSRRPIGAFPRRLVSISMCCVMLTSQLQLPLRFACPLLPRNADACLQEASCRFRSKCG